MVQITNIDAINAIRKGARISNVDPAPTELGKTTVPVMDMTPRFHRTTKLLVNQAYTNTQAAATLFTTSTTRETFFTAVKIQNQSDVTADNTVISVTASMTGGPRDQIIRINKLTTTASSLSETIYFDKPLPIDAGTTVIFANAFTVGASTTSIQIWGYEVDK